MMGDELLPKRSPDKNQRLILINSVYRVENNASNKLFFDGINVIYDEESADFTRRNLERIVA